MRVLNNKYSISRKSASTAVLLVIASVIFVRCSPLNSAIDKNQLLGKAPISSGSSSGTSPKTNSTGSVRFKTIIRGEKEVIGARVFATDWSSPLKRTVIDIPDSKLEELATLGRLEVELPIDQKNLDATAYLNVSLPEDVVDSIDDEKLEFSLSPTTDGSKWLFAAGSSAECRLVLENLESLTFMLSERVDTPATQSHNN